MNSVVFITGCSDGGIGASLALEFARLGFQVVATSRSLSSMRQLSLNHGIDPRVLDVTDFEAAKAIVDSVVADYGHIDILVNNAGAPCVCPVVEMPISTLEYTFRTNVFGPIVLVQAVVPHMVARGKGRIVNIGSITTLAYGPWAAGYVSSKAALEAMTDALRLEMKPFGIDVVLILPGAITSKINQKSVSTFEFGARDGLKLYESFRPSIIKRASEVIKATTGEKFARKVVPQILARSPSAHYAYGRLTSTFVLLHYIPLVIRDYIFIKYSGLDRKVSFKVKKVD